MNRFCGAWSASARSVRMLAGMSGPAPEWLKANHRKWIREYHDSISLMVREMEVKLPDFEDLPFWQDALSFWDRVVALGDEHAPATYACVTD